MLSITGNSSAPGERFSHHLKPSLMIWYEMILHDTRRNLNDIYSSVCFTSLDRPREIARCPRLSCSRGKLRVWFSSYFSLASVCYVFITLKCKKLPWTQINTFWLTIFSNLHYRLLRGDFITLSLISSARLKVNISASANSSDTQSGRPRPKVTRKRRDLFACLPPR